MLTQEGQRLAETYLNVAEACARRAFGRTPPTVTLDELMSAGQLGLVQALDRWPEYCTENGYQSSDHRYLVAFIQQRVTGALLDHLRSLDHLTRTQRKTVKTLVQAQDEGCNGSAVDVAAERLGVTPDVVLAAAAVQKPATLDAPNAVGESWDFPEPELTEERAAASELLGAATTAIRELTPARRMVVVLHQYYALELETVAECLGLSLEKVQEHYKWAILAVHNEMLKAALAAG